MEERLASEESTYKDLFYQVDSEFNGNQLIDKMEFKIIT